MKFTESATKIDTSMFKKVVAISFYFALTLMKLKEYKNLPISILISLL